MLMLMLPAVDVNLMLMLMLPAIDVNLMLMLMLPSVDRECTTYTITCQQQGCRQETK